MSLKESIPDGIQQVILKQCEYEIVAKLWHSQKVQTERSGILNKDKSSRRKHTSS
jgi:hypothetical protein